MPASNQTNKATSVGAELLPRTSDQILGPFYPLSEPAKGGDLTRVPGRPGRAKGQVIRLTGRVLDRAGEPVRRGKLQIWQANTFGRYTHPNDDNSAPLDECFEGFAVVEHRRRRPLRSAHDQARLLSDAAGQYSPVAHPFRGFRQARAVDHPTLLRRRPAPGHRHLAAVVAEPQHHRHADPGARPGDEPRGEARRVRYRADARLSPGPCERPSPTRFLSPKAMRRCLVRGSGIGTRVATESRSCSVTQPPRAARSGFTSSPLSRKPATASSPTPAAATTNPIAARRTIPERSWGTFQRCWIV